MATLRGKDNLKGHIPMNLQLFADDGEENQETQNTEEQTEQEESKTYTDEEVKKLIQQESDKRVTEALKTAKSKWQSEYETELEKAKSEAEKLANMTAQEKIEHERDAYKKELEQLKQKDTLNEMSRTARGILQEADINITDNLLGVLVTTDAEETKKNVEGFITMFNDAVNDAVSESLKAKPPKRGGVAGLTKQDILNIKDPVERVNQIQKYKELFN